MNSTSLEHLLIQGLISIAYALLGIVLFALGFLLIRKVSPFSIRKEIEEDQNVALAIIIASVMLGIAIIVAAAIH